MARKNNILKEKKKLTWRFYTILSSAVAIVIIGLVILLVCLYNHFNTDSYKNYFSEWTEYKINYDELDDILEDKDTSSHVFIFAYDETYFDQEEIDYLDDDDPLRSTYEKANAALQSFYKAVVANHEAYKMPENDYNKEDKYWYQHVEFYVINTTLQGNSSVLSDEAYGNMGNAPSLIYLFGESYSEKMSIKEFDYKVSGGKGDYKDLESALKQSREFIEKLSAGEESEKSTN